MTGKEFELWILYKEFQKEFEQLKRDIERIAEIRRELDNLR